MTAERMADRLGRRHPLEPGAAFRTVPVNRPKGTTDREGHV
jgi:hypothetical protein